jgi:hypothetical protein
VQPGDTNPAAAADLTPNHLMAWDQRPPAAGEISRHDLEVGSADAAGRDVDRDLVIAGNRLLHLGKADRARRIEHHCAHHIGD